MAKAQTSPIKVARRRAASKPAEATAIQGHAREGPTELKAGIAPWLQTAASAGEGFAPFDPPPAGTFDVYRKIQRTPTPAVTMSVIKARANKPFKWETRDEDVPKERVQILKNWFAPLREAMMDDILFALDYGFAPFETLWDVIDPATIGVKGQSKWILPTLKPLRVDYTTFLFQKGVGIVGLRNKPPKSAEVDLTLDKCFWYTFGGEAGDPYGSPLYENIREVWSEAEQIRKKVSRYINKISGVIGQIHYPDGTSKDQAGADRPNFMLAQALAEAASNGKWLVMQNRFSSFLADPGQITPATLELALATAGKGEWVVSFVDPGGADHSSGFKELLMYYDVLMVRGLLQLERGLLESQKSGSRADSQMHGATGELFPDRLAEKIFGVLNNRLVNDTIELNWGKSERGSIFIIPEPTEDSVYDAKLKSFHAIMQNPTMSEPVGERIDFDILMDDLGVPVLESKRGKPLDLLPVMPPAAPRPAATNRMKTPSSNGNGNGSH